MAASPKPALVLPAVSLLGALGTALGHGSVLYPPTRNAIDSELAPWKGAVANDTTQFPMTGHWKYMPFGCDCSNGTEPCAAGQGCFWFSQVQPSLSRL